MNIHVTANSKEVREGSIFFALKGEKFDGHDFIQEAFRKGASKIYAERDVGIVGVQVMGYKARRKFAEMCAEMWEHPTHTMKMIGITGTSGKTTTTYLIHHLLEKAGVAVARLGTNGGYFQGKEFETTNTTPDSSTLQRWFRDIQDMGAQAVVMEVSSHALQQDRCYAIAWDAVCFLNLSHDHLDYHTDMNQYFNAKSSLFKTHMEFSRKHGKKPIPLANHDSEYGVRLSKEVPDVKGFSPKNEVRNLKDTSHGIEFEVKINDEWIAVSCPLFGSFQIDNIVSALRIVTALGVDAKSACKSLSEFTGVPGRMEFIPNQKGIFPFVDYAHKPEALEKVLSSIHGRGNLITVFGCGGDRDRTKRPIMGEIASRLSHLVIVTSDNPRTEDPERIINEIVSGIKKNNFRVIADRRQAIQTAIQDAKAGDVIVIAGKGHENYQIVGTTKNHFDDREEVKLALNK